jgi:hypothetical protein
MSDVTTEVWLTQEQIKQIIEQSNNGEKRVHVALISKTDSVYINGTKYE